MRRSKVEPARTDTVTVSILVDDMHCASCVIRIDDALEHLPGVHRATSTLRRRTTRVVYNPQVTGAASIRAAVEALGYRTSVAE